MMDVKIRYNHNCTDDKMYWRLIIGGTEFLASNIQINVPTKTTRDDVFDTKKNEMVNKHHITCEANSVSWSDTGVAIIS
jgi:hypothetical protein